MADWFVGPVMDKLIDACSDYLQDQFRRRTGMKEELERLRENRPLIQAVVSAYTQGKITDRNLNSWLWQLRDAIDEADDVLDDFEYMKHKEQLELNMEETKVPSSFTRLFLEPARKLRRVCERALKIDPNLETLEKAVQKLDRVSAQVNTFLHLVEKKGEEQQAKDQQLYHDRASGSLPGPDFIGRDQEKEYVMQWLRTPSNHNLSLLSIVGHGGMGKTTLLQNVYADAITKEFDLKIWVCVSKDFEVEEVIADMLKCLHEWTSHLTKLPPLQEKLNSVTQSKKFLLVLDDIWEETATTKWEKVIAPLANGKLGSKILVTTRIHAAASMIADIIKNEETLTLKGLGEAQCLKLLKTHAFARMEGFREDKKLMCIAEEIVKKLSGSPLVTKVIGGVLKYDLTPEHWERVLRSNIGSVEVVPGQNINTIMPILRLSFTFLPQPLQNCFAFCGIFPQDHQFDKDDIVRMWIALGFIQESSIEGETLEDIGGRYFDVLVTKSFFDKFQDYYKMHDLLHDLAQSISSEECFRFVGGNVLSFRIPKNVRHLFVKTKNPEVLGMIKDVKNLHSLFFIDEGYGQCDTEVLAEIFETSRMIRLLFIHSSWQNMSKAIENLKHLRYLNLSVNFTQMPRSPSSLYHLRFIIYKKHVLGSCSDDFLSGDVGNLSNLRYLKLPPNMISSVPGIGKLRSLQELNEFNVKNENGYKIGELEHMSELRKLKINFLKNVNDATEARDAKLFEKTKLTNLFLNWGDTVDGRNSDMEVGSLRNIINSDLDVTVLENLKPYKKLKSLSIFSHKGASCATWMHDADLISNLEYISLNGCSEWETLPPFGQLPHLKSLYLCNMPKAKRLDYKFQGNDKVSMFPSLEVLNIKGLQVLEDWFDGAGAAAYDSFFPCLTELFLDNCPNLQELPYVPPKLKKMKIQNIGWKAALNCKQEINNADLISKLEHISLKGCSKWETLPPFGQLPRLKFLYLCNMPKVKQLDNKFHGNDEVYVFPSLEVLHMEGLQVLEDWFDIAAAYDSFFPCLTKLFLHNCPNLEELPYLPPKLKQMSIYSIGWKALNCKQGTSKSIPLKTLEVRSCPNITSLLLADVGFLSIEGCPNLISVGGLQQVESGIEKFQPILSEVVIDDPCLLPTVSIASLEKLTICNNDVLLSFTIEAEQWLPHVSSSLRELSFRGPKSLQSLPSSLECLSSLKILSVENVPQLQQLLHIPASLQELHLVNLESLQCLPTSLSAISSLNRLRLCNIPLLESLPDLPSSLDSITVDYCYKLQCLPSSLSAISSLKHLWLCSIPLLKSLPGLPSSLDSLSLWRLDSLQCLPSSLSAISSLKHLSLNGIPLLKSLPDLPSSLSSLSLYTLHNLECLPSSLSAISSLNHLYLVGIPLLKSLPDLPSSLDSKLLVDCDPKLMKRYKN